MAITVKLDDLLHARRINLTELAERMGIPLANPSILKTGKARAIRFSTLETLRERSPACPATSSGFNATRASLPKNAPIETGPRLVDTICALD